MDEHLSNQIEAISEETRIFMSLLAYMREHMPLEVSVSGVGSITELAFIRPLVGVSSAK